MTYDNFIEILKDHFYFDEKEVRSKPDKANWFEISRHLHKIPIDFVREFRDRIQWERVNFKKFKSTEFNREAEDRINKFNSLVYEDNNPPFSFTLWSYPQEDNETIIII